jgi:hypothetical protein
MVERFNAAHVEPCPRLSPSLPRASPGVRTPADLGPPRATGAPWLASALQWARHVGGLWESPIALKSLAGFRAYSVASNKMTSGARDGY